MIDGLLDRIDPRLTVVFSGVLAVLVIASVVVLVLRRAKPGMDLTELSQRVRSWWVMVIVFALAIALGRVASISFFGFLSFLALKEFFSLVPTRRADRRVLFWAYVAIPVQYVFIGYEWIGMFLVWIPVYAFLLLPLRMVLIGETEGFLRAAGTMHWGLMTTVFSISHVAALLVLPGEADASGPALVLFLVVLTQSNDVAQYVWGRLFGRARVVPKVSPGKTVAGLLGGIATTAVLGYLLAPLLTPLAGHQRMTAGVLIGVAGFVGDIVVSAVKRDVRVKDSGSLIPGHGGILDRLDSLTYTAPLFFHFMRYLHY